jgi:4-diphosphocytidyl-2-C-methyl-D-erythritol kinase
VSTSAEDASGAVSAATAGTLVEHAPAKVNLTLRVLGRRADGYHTIESLVVFARVRDRLSVIPGLPLGLAVRGPGAAASGAVADNLVLKAARALAAEIDGLRFGRFTLDKRLPVAAGVGGGSADAAAALRLIARINGLTDEGRLLAAARATGADVPVCLDPRPRVMGGIGEVLSAPLDLPPLAAVLVNPGVAVATRDVFAALRLRPGASTHGEIPRARPALMAFLAAQQNDLEEPAISRAPAIADVLAVLRTLPGCRLARMSGSGATCFALFDSVRVAHAAARTLRSAHPQWWVRASLLGSG